MNTLSHFELPISEQLFSHVFNKHSEEVGLERGGHAAAARMREMREMTRGASKRGRTGQQNFNRII
jgi:hypothetical protein